MQLEAKPDAPPCLGDLPKDAFQLILNHCYNKLKPLPERRREVENILNLLCCGPAVRHHVLNSMIDLGISDGNDPVVQDALFVAINEGHVAAIDILVAKEGAAEFLHCPYFEVGLNHDIGFMHWAVLLHDAQIVECLLKNGANPNWRAGSQSFKNKWTPLQHLINDDITNQGWPPYVDRENDGNIVALLVDHGADVNVEDEKGQTLLFKAAKAVRLDLVKLLLKHGASPNTFGLLEAVHFKTADNPFEDAPPVYFMGNVFHALALCEKKRRRDFNVHREIVQLLLDHGADPTAIYPGGKILKDKSKDRLVEAKSVIYYAWSSFLSMMGIAEHMFGYHIDEFFLLMLRNGVPARGLEMYLNSVISPVAQLEDVEVFEAFMESLGRSKTGVSDASGKNVAAISPFMFKCAYVGNKRTVLDKNAFPEARLRMIEACLKAGDDARSRYYPMQILFPYAVSEGVCPVVELMIKYGAKIDGPGPEEQDEFLESIECANCGATKKLLKCGRCHVAWFCGVKCQKAYWPFHKSVCKPNEFALGEQSGHRIPLIRAIYSDSSKVVRLLLEKGADVNIQAGGKGREATPLFAALTKKCKNQQEVLELLCAHGADVFYKNSDGETAAVYAEKVGLMESAEFLRKKMAAAEKNV